MPATDGAMAQNTQITVLDRPVARPVEKPHLIGQQIRFPQASKALVIRGVCRTVSDNDLSPTSLQSSTLLDDTAGPGHDKNFLGPIMGSVLITLTKSTVACTIFPLFTAAGETSRILKRRFLVKRPLKFLTTLAEQITPAAGDSMALLILVLRQAH